MIAATMALSAGLSVAAPIGDAISDTPALFNLTVTSINSGKYFNTLLGAEHSGAGIEALAANGYPTSFSFNATEANPNVGSIIYSVPASPQNFDSRLQFYQNQSSNVQAGYFGFGEISPLFTFSHEQLFHVSDTAAQETEAYFYMCPTDFEAYEYNTLSFVADGAEPSDAACDPVTVHKVSL